MQARTFLFRITVVAAILNMSCVVCARADQPANMTLAPSTFQLPSHASAVAGHLEDEVAVRGRTLKDKPYVIEMGSLAVKPNTTYRTAYTVTAKSLNHSANFYLMVREHEAPRTKPFPNYTKTSVRHRELSANMVDRPVTRRLQISTGEQTHALSIALVISELDGELRIGPLTLTDIEQQLWEEYRTTMVEVKAKAAARKPLVPRTLVFSRSQMKYGLERNYEHVWTDRPLFVNRAFRTQREHVTPFPSYARILREVVQYDIDGLAFFPETKGRMGMYELTDRAAIEGVGLLTEFIPTPDIQPKMAALEAALKCKSAARINGKILITSYVAGALTPEQWDEILTALRKKHGDVFVFLPALVDTVKLRQKFAAGKPISRKEIEERQVYLRRYLDVCDGIYFNYAAAFKMKDRTFDEAFYRELFIPVFKSVLGEPKYRNKYFGLSAYHSHSNPDLSIGLLEDGTRTLRHSFEAAMEAKPDVIICPEWDEVNENTCFRPTTCNSTTTQRILRYYMSKIKYKVPTPLSDDDVSVPNLILSTRKMVTIGEKLVIELLNVPDDESNHSYVVQLRLLDESGRELRSVFPVEFDADVLREQRYEIPIEGKFALAKTIVPVLQIGGYKGKDFLFEQGLPHTQVRATWNWDYKFVKQPLRELLPVKEAKLVWSEQNAGINGSLGLAGQVETDEELALVEVVADGDVVHAVSPTDEILRATSDLEVIRIEYRSTRSKDHIIGTFKLNGAEMRWLSNRAILHQAESVHQMGGRTLTYRGPVSPHLRWTCLLIPREQLSGARIDVQFADVRINAMADEVLDKQMIAATGKDGLHVAVYPYRRTLDIPEHLNSKSASFDVPVWPWQSTEQYHLRLTSKTGKTYRTRPLMLPTETQDVGTTLRAYSDRGHEPVDVKISSSGIPDIAYAFDPSRGAVLLTDAGKQFWASLGGFPDTTSGRGGRHSASMFQGDRNGYPANAAQTAPQWVEDESSPALQFDGIGTFIHLPREALPRRSSFTLEFEIKPEADKDANLLLVRAHRPASLSVAIRDGMLHATYFNDQAKLQTIATNLPIPVGQWSTVRVSYDLESMKLWVNDQMTQGVVAGPGYDFGPIVFGGFGETSRQFDPQTGNPGWFKGLLRSLRIKHNSK